mgnify:CR=1 FL=1
MKRRWKKFLAGVLSAALALNLAAPLALADSVRCTVAGVALTGDVNQVPTETRIAGQVSYLNNTLTFDGDVTLTTVGVADLGKIPLVKAADGNDGLKLVANGKVTGRTKGNGIEGAEKIDGGEYDLTYADLAAAYKDTKPKGILGGNAGTTITAGTKITLKGFHTGIAGGDVQINGTVNITGEMYKGATYGIANSTTMNPGSELMIYADRYIGKDCLLTYNGGHLLMIVGENGDHNNIVQGRLSIGNVSRFWYRTDENGAYTEINKNENFENFTAAIEQDNDYLELTDVDPNQQASETYDLWVAGKQVTETNQHDVLGDGGSVKFDPTTNTLTLSDAFLTPDGDANFTYWIDSDLTEELTITGKATLSNADGILTEGPLTLNNADLTFTGDDEGGGEEAIRAGRSDEDITIRNSKVTIAGTNSEGNFFQYGIRCGKLIVADSTLDVKTYDSAIAAETMEVSGAGTVVMAESDSPDEGDYALELDKETSLTLRDGLALVDGEVNKSKKAKIARPEQAPTDYYKVYWVVHPGDEPVNGGMQFPGAIFGSEEEKRLFEGWFLEDGTRLEDSPYYMGPDAGYVGNLDRDVTFYGHWRTAESAEGSEDGEGFGTLLAGGAVIGAAGVVAYQVGTELILDQLLPAGVAVPHTRAELALLLWNTAGRPAPAALPAFADVADPELANAAQWAIEQGYLKARADGSFKPDKGVAKWRVIRGYRAVTEP